IAGNHPNEDLVKLCSQYPHIQLISDWNNARIMEAIRDAHINVLPTFQGTGIKLKLLNALFCGRFCIVNETMVAQTGLESECIIANTPEKLNAAIEKFWKINFEETDIELRKKLLEGGLFSNEGNARKIQDILKTKNASE